MGASIPSRIVGVLILIATVGLVSCQALFLGPDDQVAAQVSSQTDGE